MRNKEENLGAENIKKLRESMGLSQHELSQLLSLSSRSVICRYEKGVLKPSVDTCHKIIKLAAKYKYIIDLDYLRPN